MLVSLVLLNACTPKAVDNSGNIDEPTVADETAEEEETAMVSAPTETSTQEEESEESDLSPSTQPPTTQPKQGPPPPKIKMEFADDLREIIIELLARLPFTIYDEEDKDILFDAVMYNGFSDIALSTGDIELFDLENSGMPFLILHKSYYWGEGQSAEIYKLLDGKYVMLGFSTTPYSFYKDNKGRLALYAGGDDYISNVLEFSYIDTSTGELLRDSVDIEGKLHWFDSSSDEPDDPRIIDNSLKRIAEIDIPLSIYEDAKRRAYERLAKAKADAKTMLAIDGSIVSYDITTVEYEGVLYIPAQDMANFMGANLIYDESSNTITLIFKDGGICEIVNGTYVTGAYRDESLPGNETAYPPKMIDGAIMLPAVCSYRGINDGYFNYESYYIPELNLIYVF